MAPSAAVLSVPPPCQRGEYQYLRLSLIEELKRGKAPDHDLFDGIPIPEPGSQRERSMPAVKAFGRYFHSFRRWFITKAERAGIPETTIASVVGHKRQGMTFGTYSAGPELEQFRACAEAVKLPE